MLLQKMEVYIMMYQEFLSKVVKYGIKKDKSYNSCSVTYDEYKNIVEPLYMSSKFDCADDFCKATFLNYVD